MSKDVHLKSDEEVLYELRRYGLTYFGWFVLIALFVGFPFFYIFELFQMGWVGYILFFVPVSVGMFLFIRKWFYWSKNKMIVTTHRIIDFDRKGVFNKIISRLSYDEVEDISGEIKGFFGTIFRYGTIKISTGSGSIEIILNKVKDPVGIQAELKDLKQKYKIEDTKKEEPLKIIKENLDKLEKKELVKVMNKSQRLLDEE